MSMRNARTARRAAGFSLIEVLVALGIGLVITLAITSLLISSEGSKRTITSLNDTSQNGSFLALTLDQAVRSAGSGFVQASSEFGCRLGAARGGATLLPFPSAAALPAPFDVVVTRPVRLAPVVIHSGVGPQSSDILTIMTGAGGFGETGFRIVKADADALVLTNTITLQGNDLVLLTNGSGNCLLEQVAPAFTTSNNTKLDQPLTLGGNYYLAAVGGVPVTAFGSPAGTTSYAQAYALGSATATSGQPTFKLFGVGANQVLFSYDLLQLENSTAGAAVPISDGVYTLRAVYGLDTNNDQVVDTWVAPTGASFGSAALLDGTSASNNRLRQIVAVRIGLVVQSSIKERESINGAPTELKLFESLGAPGAPAQTVALPDSTVHYRAIEFTVPLRNFTQ